MDDECVILSSEVVIYSGYNFLFFLRAKRQVSAVPKAPSGRFRAGHPKRVSRPVFLVSREKKRGTFFIALLKGTTAS
tara:strand:+ start:184 stop:414 length:231 start_codon:yes stop_codon:yes gene_type:complete